MSKTKLLMKNVRPRLRACGLLIRHLETGEFRVAFKFANNEAAAYYTTDLADALASGLSMARERAPWDVRVTPPFPTDAHVFRAGSGPLCSLCRICGELSDHARHKVGVAPAPARAFDPITESHT